MCDHKSNFEDIAKQQLIHGIQVSELKNKVGDLNKKMNFQNKKLDRVLLFLENDPSTGGKGYIQQTRENTKFINDFKSKWAVLIALVFVLTTIGSWYITIYIK